MKIITTDIGETIQNPDEIKKKKTVQDWRREKGLEK